MMASPFSFASARPSFGGVPVAAPGAVATVPAVEEDPDAVDSSNTFDAAKESVVQVRLCLCVPVSVSLACFSVVGA